MISKIKNFADGECGGSGEVPGGNMGANERMEDMSKCAFGGGRKMTCDVSGCKWNDGNGNCECDGIYISDAETGEPLCMSAEFEN